MPDIEENWKNKKKVELNKVKRTEKTFFHLYKTNVTKEFRF